MARKEPELERINGLDLFSGIGGISLALQPWVRTVCYVEIEPYCQGVLQSRIADGRLDDASIWDDITTFDGKPWAGGVDIITGGFPCQDISVAGNGAGLDGERSGLWWEMHRLIGEIRPGFVFLENVPAITGRGGREVVGALAAMGYDARWGVLSAFDVGAPHERERWWALAYNAGCMRELQPQGGESDIRGRFGDSSSAIIANIDRTRLSRRCQAGADSAYAGRFTTRDGLTDNFALSVPTYDRDHQPLLGGRIHGISHRVERIRALGNSVVPACAREAFKRLSGLGD